MLVTKKPKRMLVYETYGFLKNKKSWRNIRIIPTIDMIPNEWVVNMIENE